MTQAILKEKGEMLDNLIENQNEPNIEAGLYYYYDNYETKEMKDRASGMIKSMTLEEKKKMLKILAYEIINRDMIDYIRTGKNNCIGINGFVKIIR